MATGVPHIFANVWFLIWRAGLNNDRFMVELMVFKLGSCLLVPGATLSWQGCFQSQGQTTSHLSACFPSVPSQDFFRIVTSHIWHRGVFLGADAYVIRSIPGKLLRPCISQYLTMSAHQLHGGFTFLLFKGWISIHFGAILTFDIACVLWGLSWTQHCIEGNKAALKESTNVLARQTIMQGKDLNPT